MDRTLFAIHRNVSAIALPLLRVLLCTLAPVGLGFLLVCGLLPHPAAAQGRVGDLEYPPVGRQCEDCHPPRPYQLLGTLDAVLPDAGMFQITTGPKTWVVSFDADTSWNKVPWTQGMEEAQGSFIMVILEHPGEHGNLYARNILVKPVPAIPDSRTMTPGALARRLTRPAERGTILVADVRSREDYAYAHVPGAVSIPGAAWEQRIAERLRPGLDAVLVYGYDGPTTLAFLSTVSPRQGNDAVQVLGLAGGMATWRRQGLPVVVAQGPLAVELEDATPPILIDLRPRKHADAQHIPGAVSIPVSELPTWKERMPPAKDTPIVIYGFKGMETPVVRSYGFLTRRWGYTNVRILSGGSDGWKQRGGPIRSGRAGIMLAYTPPRAPGELSSENFLDLAEGAGDTVFLVDVDSPEEFEETAVPGAVNIPLPELAARLANFPNDQGPPPVFYSTTSAKAEMAFHVAAFWGVDSSFLPAPVRLEPDGSYSIGN